ncbi:MAG: ferrous iron transport protein A [Sedimentisphaerales bacterium]|nr:ferrous iron transport protein A [Sedimentisphaerales bacterium]
MTEAKANLVSLVRMRSGQKCKIVEINGGYGLARKLEALGIRTGKEITKISEQLLRGPVLLQHNNTQAAVRFGMASRILVEVNGMGEI